MNFKADGVTLSVVPTDRSSSDLWRAVELHLASFPPSTGPPRATLHLDQGKALSLNTTTAEPLDEADRRWIPYLDPVIITEPGYVHAAVGQFVDMASLFFANRSAVRIHAACLVDSDDRCWLIVGPSGSGKSTLALQMIASGARYVTDERVTVGRDGAGLIVSGLPRPIHVRDARTSVSSEAFVAFASTASSDGFRDLVFCDQVHGSVACGPSHPTSLVAMGHWSRGTSRAAVARFLVEQSFDAIRTGPAALGLIAELVATSTVHLVPERSIRSLGQLARPRFAPEGSVAGPARFHRRMIAPGWFTASDTMTVDLDGESLVWVPGDPPTVAQLSASASAQWRPSRRGGPAMPPTALVLDKLAAVGLVDRLPDPPNVQ